jgi:hypothetical protein
VAPSDQFDEFAREAARPLTPAVIKRGKRIHKAGAVRLIGELQLTFDRIAEKFGPAVAIDLFEFVLEIDRERNPRPKRRVGRPAGPSDEGQDVLLLATFNGHDPDSLLSRARAGGLLLEAGRVRLVEPGTAPRMSQGKLLHHLRKWFRATSGGQLGRRLKALKRKARRR